MVQELWELSLSQRQIIGKLNEFIKNRLAEKRKYQNGQKVEVYSDRDRLLGVGIISSASLAIYLDIGNIKVYIDNPDRWEKDLNTITYRVNKMKKDGTMHKHLLSTCEEEKGRYWSYIKPIE